MARATQQPQISDEDFKAATERLEAAKSVEALRQEILTQMANYVGQNVVSDSPVTHHTEPANMISLPGNMTEPKAIKVLTEVERNKANRDTFNRQFYARVEDGAVALTRVLERYYGTAGRGIKQESFFGTRLPQRNAVTVGLEMGPNGKTIPQVVNVLASEFSFAPLEAEISIDSYWTPEHPALFQMSVTTFVRYQPSVNGLFAMIEDELANNSIYKGQHVLFTKQEDENYSLKHLLKEPDPTIVYTEQVQMQLEDDVLGLIRYSDILRRGGIEDNFKVLLYGPVGTGKTEACIAIGSEAVAHGRTVIEMKVTGLDSIAALVQAFEVARMYRPAVLIAEDIDKFFPQDRAISQSQLSVLTNLFDGADKDSDVSVVMTTNHIRNIRPEMTRAGRLTSQIEIGPLDAVAIEHMLKIVLGDQLDSEADFPKVWDVVKEYGPSFIRSTFEKAKQVSVTRHGQLNLPLGTRELVGAAYSKRSQAELHAAMQADLQPEPSRDQLLTRITVAFEKAVAAVTPVVEAVVERLSKKK